MKLVLLGSGGYHPNERRHTPCALLPECGVMFDAGTAIFRAPEYLALDHLDIFLTHAHLDHVVGLTFLFDVMHAHPLERLRVHGEGEKLQAVREHLFHPALFPVDPPYEACPLHGPVDLCDGGRLQAFPLSHPGDSLGYRIDWPGRSMALVTDTTACPNAPYLDAIREVDLLLHECYFTDDWAEWAATTGHSTITPVVELARAAGVGRLVLIHVNPLSTDDEPFDLAAARKIFPHIEVGEDRMEIDF